VETLQIEPTFKTPSIHFEASSGNLTIGGRIFPENPKEFFGPVLHWLDQYTRNPAAETHLNLNISYFNSSANEYLFRCCKLVEGLAAGGHKADITWFYETEDDDMRQMGEDFRELLKINFEIHAIS
jgi:hypothetical protein